MAYYAIIVTTLKMVDRYYTSYVSSRILYI